MANELKQDFANRIANTDMYAQTPQWTTQVTPPSYARGGSVKSMAKKYGVRGYAEGDIVEVDGEEYAPVPATETPVYSAADMAALRDRYQVENAALNDMMAKYIDDSSPGKRDNSEMYFRLASAFLSPTKTKQGFMENLGMAGKEMAEYSGAKRAAEQEQMRMRLEAQKLRRDMAKDETELGIKMMKSAGSGGHTPDDYRNARARFVEHRRFNPVTSERGPDVRIEDFLPGGSLHDPYAGTGASTPQAPRTIAEATGVDIPFAPTVSGAPASAAAGMPTFASLGLDPNDPAAKKVLMAARTSHAEKTTESEAERDATDKALQSNMQKILNIAGVDPETGKDEIKTLIRASTSGGLQNLITQGERFFGTTNEGGKAIQALTRRLNAMTYQLVGNQLDRGITDSDIVFLKEINASIQNPNLTADERIYAWDDAVNYMEQIARNDPSRIGASGTPLLAGEDTPSASAAAKKPAPASGADIPRRNSKGWVLYHDPVNNSWAYVGPNGEIEEVR